MTDSRTDELWRSWRKKQDATVREELLNSHVPLVQRVLSRLKIGLGAGVSERLGEDLRNAGVIGLIEAFERFSENEGVKFETFAYHRIRGAMLDELRRQDWLSKGCRRRLKEFQKAWREVEQKLGRRAEEEEIAAHLKISVEDFRRELVEVGPATLVFLDGLKNADGFEGTGFSADHLADLKARDPAAEAERSQILRRLENGIEGLPESEKSVLTMAVYDELGQKEIAEVLGLTPSRISQIYSKAVLRLQVALGAGQ